MGRLWGLVAAVLVAAAPAAAEDTSRFFVTFKGAPTAADEALLAHAGGELVYRYTIVPALAVRLSAAGAEALSRNPRVLRVEADARAYAVDAELDAAWGVKHIGAGPVHDAGNKGAGVRVAVIDTGIDGAHPDLAVAGGYNFVAGNGNWADDNGHGTHVAGTIAARDNGAGVVGVAPSATLFALKVLDASGGGNFTDIVAALDWCVRNNIQVTNNSYGSSMDPGVTVHDAFDAAAAAGVLHIAAAGNSGTRTGKGDNIGYPANYVSVAAVAAVDASDARASFSSTGAAAELSAPGVGIYSTWPGGGYQTLNGTSMASPHAAGAAALVWASGVTDANGDGHLNDEVRARLVETAHDLGAGGWDPQYGYGLVDLAAAITGTATTPPPATTGALHVAVSTDKPAYVNGETARITAVVSDANGARVAGATVTFVLVTANGKSRSAVGTSGGDGTVVATYKASPKRDGVGTYQVTASAQKTGYTDGSGETSFQVSQ